MSDRREQRVEAALALADVPELVVEPEHLVSADPRPVGLDERASDRSEVDATQSDREVFVVRVDANRVSASKRGTATAGSREWRDAGDRAATGDGR